MRNSQTPVSPPAKRRPRPPTAGWIRALAFGALALFVVASQARPAMAQEVVDVALVLAVDVSLSMSHDELKIQRDGYVAALTHPHVIDAIREGIHGRIAVAYIEWAGDQSQYVVIPWTIISSMKDAEQVVAGISASPPNSARRTSISGGLRFAQDMFAESPFKALKRVIDVSGDGPNNQGEWVDIVRDEVVSHGITINGLPLMTDNGLLSTFGVPDLDRYYESCVIGGPGAFVIPVNDWTLFPEAVRRKLVLEIASGPMPEPWLTPDPPGQDGRIVKAAVTTGYDCQSGEKRWRGRMEFWEDKN